MKFLKLLVLSAAILMATVGASHGAPVAIPLAVTAPSGPGAITPVNGTVVQVDTTGTLASVAFKWSDTASVSGDFYDIEIASDAAFSTILESTDSGGTAPCGITVTGPGLSNTYTSSTITYQAAQKYYWRVRAYNAASNCTAPIPTYASGWSTFSFRTSVEEPVLNIYKNGVLDTPPYVLVNNLDNGNVAPITLFSWNGITSATGYILEVSQGDAFSSFILDVSLSYTSTGYTPTVNLPANTTLYARVEAVNATYGNSAWSNIVTFVTANPGTIPVLLEPGNTKVTNDLTPGLFWNESVVPGGTNFTDYEVEVSIDSTFQNQNDMCVDDTTDSTVQFDPGTTPPIAHLDMGIALANAVSPYPESGCPTFTDSSSILNLDPVTTFYWRVRTVSQDLVPNTYTSNWSKVFEFLTSYGPVTNLSVTPNDGTVSPTHVLSNLPTFTWDAVYGHPADYRLQISTSPQFTQVLSNISIVALQYTPKGFLPAGATLYWRVRAEGLYGPGPWSASDTSEPLSSFTTGYPPTSVVLSSPANKALLTNLTPTLIWSVSKVPASATFGTYTVEVDTDPAFGSPMTDDSSNVPTLADPTNRYDTLISPSNVTLNNSTIYYWRVQACNNASTPECSQWSSTFYFRTPVAAPTGLSSSGTYPGDVLTWTGIPNVTYQVQLSPLVTFGKGTITRSAV
ncbi:MAG: hypothetical protein WBW94_09750, partial [Anaerolineales bacterium]